MAQINQLPYFQIPNTKETNEIARFLLKKIKKILKRKIPLSLSNFCETR
jgi:hypothetical protein